MADHDRRSPLRTIAAVNRPLAALLGALLVASALTEGVGLILLVPMIAWYLAIPLMAALMMDLAIMLFYLVYTFFFNIAYDRVYPLPETRAAA